MGDEPAAFTRVAAAREPGMPATDREIPVPAAFPSLGEDVPAATAMAPGALGCGSPGNGAHAPGPCRDSEITLKIL